MKKIIDLSLRLLHFCKRTNTWDPDFTESVILNLLEELSKHADFSNVFEDEIAYAVILSELSHVEEQHPEEISDLVANKFVDQLKLNLNANVDDHWIVIPLRNAELNTNINFGDFHFITGTREEKILRLGSLCQIRDTEAQDRAKHTETSRSPGFFEHPLLAIKVRHQTGYVSRIAHNFSYGSIVSLDTLYWANVYPNYPQSLSSHILHRTTEHLAVWSHDHWRCSHEALNFRNFCREFRLVKQ